jgi:hypothetical protein
LGLNPGNLKPLLKLSVLVFFGCFFFNECAAQSTAITSDGKKVLLNADGTWIYILETDSLPRSVDLPKPHGERDASVAAEVPVVVAPVITEMPGIDSASIAKPVVVVPVPKPKPPLVLDCPVLVSFERDVASDRYVGATRLQKVPTDSNVGVKITFVKSKNNPLRWSLTVFGEKHCFAEDEKIRIAFKDGTNLMLENNGKKNCDGVFMLLFGNTADSGKEDIMEKMRNVEISGIRVGSKSFVDANFSEDDSKIFKASLNCLMSNK